MDDMESKIRDVIIYKSLIDLYTTIAGLTSGYISAIMKTDGLTKAEAEEAIMKIDQEAREKVDEAYKFWQRYKDRGGDE